MTSLRLDDLYRMTAHIYGDRNSTRPKEATLTHFVEVCGMLTVHERRKKKEGFDLTDALCKALGWYFPLLAKMRVQSVEQLVFRKFPSVCPYCRLAPHVEADCKQVRGTEATVNHAEVIAKYNSEWENRPQSLNSWQKMFADIYPRNIQEGSRSIVALMEELGELSEAVRVFDIHPQYFLGEAADTFSYLMGIATEHQMRESIEGRDFSFETEYLARYPGLCTQCGSQVCVCPAVPSATIGRMAKELEISATENPFIVDLREFDSMGKQSAHDALEEVGGYNALIKTLPFDRGDANHALVHLCLTMADAVQNSNFGFAEMLRGEAIRIGANPQPAGSPSSGLNFDGLITKLREAWRELTEEEQDNIKSTGGLVEGLSEAFETIRVLFIAPSLGFTTNALNLPEEQRSVKEAIKGNHENKIVIDDLPAARANDFRSALLKNNYDIVHFTGHANSSELVFESESGTADHVPLDAFAKNIAEYPVKCVILNACESVQSLVVPISPITIGMDKSVTQAAGIEFSRGFYEALSRGRSFERAFTEGKNAVALTGADSDLIKMIR